MDPRIIFQRSRCTSSRYQGQPDSRRVVTSVQFLRTETFPWGGEVVGILATVSELPWALAWHGATLVPMSRIWRGPVAVAWGGLQVGYQLAS